jgi:antitoxin component YwqK of YwqJK toxin-antitoxin module
MKQILILAFSITLLISCEENVTVNNDIQVSSKNVVLDKPIQKPVKVVSTTGSFMEKYENGNLKTEGWRNSSSQRDGIWYSYYEHGVKWSELSYVDGLKEGISMVYFPDGTVHYKGQYKNDKKVGTWTFYNEDGTVKNEKKQ